MHDPRLGLSTLAFGVLTAAIAFTRASAQSTRSHPSPEIPGTWEDRAVATLELPLANARASPVPVSAEYYYRIPVRPIYKTYPVYHPSKEPAGYFERLTRLEPEVVSFDPARTTSEEDWIRFGE